MIRTRTYVVPVLLAIIGTSCLSGCPVQWYYTRMRGADLLIAKGERINQIKAICNSLCAFRSKHGRFPASQAEWASEEPNVATLLREPEWSRERGYTVHFERLGLPATEDVNQESQLLIEDPGISWPGEPGSSCDRWRVGLTIDGRLVSYTLVYPIHEDRVLCP